MAAPKNYEETDFPILCEGCLGDNPYMRMTKEAYGKQCKVCSRPFTLFHWQAGKDERFKKTEICQFCSRLKNVCQGCLLDLQYFVPTHVRDMALNIQQDLPTSDVNRQYFAQNADRLLANGLQSYEDERQIASHEFLSQNAERKHHQDVKLQQQFGPFGHQHIHNHNHHHQHQHQHYHQPPPLQVTASSEMAPAAAHADPNIKTLYLTNVPPSITDSFLQHRFQKYGPVQRVSVIPRMSCALVTFEDKDAAQRALATESTMGGITFSKDQKQPSQIQWARPRPKSMAAATASGGAATATIITTCSSVVTSTATAPSSSADAVSSETPAPAPAPVDGQQPVAPQEQEKPQRKLASLFGFGPIKYKSMEPKSLLSSTNAQR